MALSSGDEAEESAVAYGVVREGWVLDYSLVASLVDLHMFCWLWCMCWWGGPLLVVTV